MYYIKQDISKIMINMKYLLYIYIKFKKGKHIERGS